MRPTALPYAAIDAAWAERQLAAFRSLSPAPPADAFPAFLLGRLLADDLRASCRPALPSDVSSLHGVTVQGTCILQVVDVVNIGANFESRTEDAKGPTRTLKLCLTDGHQLVFGFEFVWLPQFSVQTPRGSKVAVQNVDIRHGLLLLTPNNCQLLGTSAEMAAQHQKDALMSLSQDIGEIRATGAYAAAITTAQFGSTMAMNKTAIVENSASSTGITATMAVSARVVETGPPRTPTASVPTIQTPPAQQRNAPGQPPRAASNRSNQTANRPPTQSAKRPQEKPPPVFVDVISSDEEFASDTTDPMVEHLFYSPNTPKVPPTDRQQQQQQPLPPASAGVEFSSRKRQRTSAVPAPIGKQQAPSSEVITIDETPPLPPPPPRRQIPRVVDPSQPFQYFTASQGHPHLAALRPGSDQRLVEVRAFVKSVAGFQFQTGEYQLRVLVEDCSQVHEVNVDPAFVGNLMGVPCAEFTRAMQQSPSIAHRWAARMQFALMTLEGIMSFRIDRKSSSETALTLMTVRETTQDDAWKLLARIRQQT